MPVWAFHGAKDDVVPITRSQEMVDTIKTAGGNVKFTVYPELGHNCWDITYDNQNLYKWFLKHRSQKNGK
jgi:dipeptidyl aminopeptidase/acylaminoacyl peptidase